MQVREADSKYFLICTTNQQINIKVYLLHVNGSYTPRQQTTTILGVIIYAMSHSVTATPL